MATNRTKSALLLAVGTLLLAGVAGPALASPAPIPACSPCSQGFVWSAESHGLDTDVQRSEATVRVHENGSATWTARVVPTNQTVLDRLATNESLAQSVAMNSFGTRYGEDIPTRLLSTRVSNGTFVMRYRTADVVESGPLGASVLTYFRDDPGSYVYTDLGADELTVVAPDGTTIARGFGTVSDERLTATNLPGDRNGPFVVFVPDGTPLPGFVGWLAVVSSLSGVIFRNLLAFVAVPGLVFVGGLAAVRQFVGTERDWSVRTAGGIVAAAGVAMLLGVTVAASTASAIPTPYLLAAGLGVTLVGLGAAVVLPEPRAHLTAPRIVGGGVAVALLIGVLLTAAGASDFDRTLVLGFAFLPGAVGIGWADARATVAEAPASTSLFAILSVSVLGGLAVIAPLTALGNTLFFIYPMLLTGAGVVAVVVAIPCYLLGVSGARTA